MGIRKYSFNNIGWEKLGQAKKGKNWPVIYFITNTHKIYIGETTSAYVRFGQHLADPQKKELTAMRVVFDETYNKSVILDFEQKLIKYFEADGTFQLLNRNAGQSSQHDYYQREQYLTNFKRLWSELLKEKLVKNDLYVLENCNMFKYSPYNALTEEQNNIAISVLKDIWEKISTNTFGVSLINGGAGTGKTILAISLIYSIVNASAIVDDEFLDEEANEKIQILKKIKEYIVNQGKLKIGLVFPMSGIRTTIASVFRKTGNGLSADMVLSPYNLKDNEYDILFVDESHRLMRRKNLGRMFKRFNECCSSMGLDPKDSSQLDWVLRKSKYCVLFYDQDQSIKSSDITYNQYQSTLRNFTSRINELQLTVQMRCLGGESYLSYIKDILNCRARTMKTIENYEFKLFDDVQKMVDEIKVLDKKFDLCKTVAGYSWTWKTKYRRKPKNNYDYYNQLIKSGKYDIDIDGHKFIWNLTTEGWIKRSDSHDTIGCIHTTQGYDLNYVGVIFGREIDYNPKLNQIEIDLNLFYDRNAKNGCDEATVKEYIINTYTTMLARGIKGCYVYAYNQKLKDYLSRFIKK